MLGFTWPSATLLAQSALSGVFTGALYGLTGLGLSLSWGLLRLINLAHFALVFLAAYLCYQLAYAGVDPLLAIPVLVPVFFGLGVGLQWVMEKFSLTPFNSLLVTFGLTSIVEAVIQAIWTADYRKLESSYSDIKFQIDGIYFPLPETITLAITILVSVAVWAVMRFTDIGKALRAAAHDGAMASAFGVDRYRNALLLAGVCGAIGAVAGICLALSHTLAPAQIYAWIGVVFAAVMLGGLGNPLGPLVAGMIIGISEALTMSVIAPSWAPIVSFTLLIVILVVRPSRFS